MFHQRIFYERFAVLFDSPLAKNCANLETLQRLSCKAMRRGTKTRSDSESPDLSNMNHSTDISETTSILEDGATPSSIASSSHSKKEAKTVKVALPGVKKVQSAVKKKKSTPDLVSVGCNRH